MSPLTAQGRADQLQVLWRQPSGRSQFRQLVLILQQDRVVQTLPYEEGENNKKNKPEEKGRTGKAPWIKDTAPADNYFASNRDYRTTLSQA